MYEFGDRLRRLRRDRCISLEEVATAVGTSKSTISKYERGLQDAPLEIGYKLAAYFMVSVEWLCGSGDAEKIDHNIPEAYTDVIRQAVKAGVPPIKLQKMIELLAKD